MTVGLAAQILMPLLLEMVSHCSQNTNKLFTIFHLALFGLETLVSLALAHSCFALPN